MEQTNYSLKAYNTFGIDVKAKRFIEYSSTKELIDMVKAGVFKEKFLHIGGGSNLLFTKDFDGTILHSKMKGIEEIEMPYNHVMLRVASGEKWDDVVEYCVEHGLYGAENLSHIPGEIGAAAVQNIGAYGAEINDLTCSLIALDVETGDYQFFTNEMLEYGYRKSLLKRPDMKKYIVVSVNIFLSKSESYNLEYKALKDAIDSLGVKPTLRLVRDTIINIRKSKLPEPEEIGSAGSFFMNPVVSAETFERVKREYPNVPHYEISENEYKIPAGWLIDQCGWKGKTVGRAGVYEKQALVLVNRGGATGSEILELAEAIVKSVTDKFGPEFKITPEVNIF